MKSVTQSFTLNLIVLSCVLEFKFRVANYVLGRRFIFLISIAISEYLNLSFALRSIQRLPIPTVPLNSKNIATRRIKTQPSNDPTYIPQPSRESYLLTENELIEFITWPRLRKAIKRPS